MEPMLQNVVVYAGCGGLLLIHGIFSKLRGSIGFGNRLFSFRPRAMVTRENAPKRFNVMISLYLLAGATMLALGLYALYCHNTGTVPTGILGTILHTGAE